MKNILASTLDILFPTQCVLCNNQGPDICKNCLSHFGPPKTSNHEWIFSAWDYHDKKTEKIMRLIKNTPNHRIAKICSDVLVRTIIKNPTAQGIVSGLSNPIIIPIPIGRARWRTRGYNQSSLLAHPIAKNFNYKTLSSILIKSRNTKKQGTTKSRTERLENIQDSFTVPKNKEHLIASRDIIIVDDITTTGSTLLEARKTLLAAKARRVIALTIAN